MVGLTVDDKNKEAVATLAGTIQRQVVIPLEAPSQHDILTLPLTLSTSNYVWSLRILP